MKVLIIRFSSIGDIVLTSPVIRILHNQLGAEITYLTKEKYHPILAANPYIHKVITLGKSWPELMDALRFQSFDLIVDLHKNIRSLRIRYALGVKALSFDKLSIEKWLYLTANIDRLKGKHIVDRYVNSLSTLPVKDDGLGLDFFLPANFSPRHIAKSHRITIVAGGTYVTKRIPSMLIQKIISRKERSFNIIGGSDVDQNTLDITSDNVLNLVGQLSVMESAAVIQSSDLVISGDTGFMHIAAAFQKSIITIWGSTDPIFGFSPYYGARSTQRSISISVEQLSCRPCSKYGRSSCPKRHLDCLHQIDVQQVLDAIETLLT